MNLQDKIGNEEDFVRLFSQYVIKASSPGEYFFPESPMGLWVVIDTIGVTNFITISGWSSDNPDPILDKTVELPLCVEDFVKLLYAREDASRIVCRKEEDPFYRAITKDWATDQRFWREEWFTQTEGMLNTDALLGMFRRDYLTKEWVSEHDDVSLAFLEDSILAVLHSLTIDPMANEIDLEQFKKDHWAEIHSYFEELDKALTDKLTRLAKKFQESK